MPIAQRIANSLVETPARLTARPKPLPVGSCSAAAAAAATAASSYARLRFVQAAPDVAAADAWVDGRHDTDSLALGASSDYLLLDAGPHTVQFTPAGITATHLVSVTVDVLADADYTLALVGQTGSLQAQLIADENHPLPRSGALVRFVNLSPDAGQMELTEASGRLFSSKVAYRGVGDYATLVLNTDQATQKITQVEYRVSQAETGTWRGVLGGNPGADDQYVFTVLGIVPAPDLAAVTAVLTDPNTAEIGWALTSP